MAEDSPIALYLSVGLLLLTILYMYMLLAGKKKRPPLVAVCELGPNGKPIGSVATSEVTAPLPPHIARAQRSPSGSKIATQFVPEINSRGVSGTVTLTEEPGGSVLVEYDLVGLKPGAHGFHVNESADFSNGCVSAGPIYNPHGKRHGGPKDSERMVGDLGNVTADGTGRAKGKLSSTLIKLKGPYSVVGRSMMVHADADDLGKGDNSKASESGLPKNGFCSLVTGNAGARLACGEIKLK